MPDTDPRPYAVPTPHAVTPTAPPRPWSTSPYGPPQPPPQPQSRTPLVLSIIALVTAGSALLIALAMVAWFLAPADPGFDDGLSDARSNEYIRGQITVTDGAIAGSLLEGALERQIYLQDGYVDEMSCPDTTQVRQGAVTLCHGDVDGYEWTGIVIFEDAEGTYFLDER